MISIQYINVQPAALYAMYTYMYLNEYEEIYKKTVNFFSQHKYIHRTTYIKYAANVFNMKRLTHISEHAVFFHQVKIVFHCITNYDQPDTIQQQLLTIHLFIEPSIPNGQHIYV